MNEPQTAPNNLPLHGRFLAVVEVALIFLLLYIFAGSPPPGDDEPHYLGKAKQYWNPDWLAGDFFLETPDAHVVFNWTIGWLTLFFSLTATAWMGRCAAWLLLAIAWRRLSWALLPQAFASLLTMALFLVFQEHGTAAREWIVGGVEAKCFAYVFVILGLEQLVRGRWFWVWPLLGVGAAFHVLVGGWAVVAALLAWAATKDRAPLISMLPSLLFSGVLSLPGLLPGLMLSWNADPATIAQANQIYVFDRLSHHLLFYDFPLRYKAQFLAVLAAWLGVCYLTRKDESRLPLRRFVLGSIVIGVAGIVVDQVTMHRPELAASLLRFYWYRLPDMMVPLGLAFALVHWGMSGTALAAGVLPNATNRRLAPTRSMVSNAILPLLILFPMVVLGWGFAQQSADRRRTADIQARICPHDPTEYHDWRNTCAWIEAHTEPGERFMIPPNISSFRWYAERSEVVSAKDIPQNAEGIVEWSERLRRVRRWYGSLADEGWDAERNLELRTMASSEEYDFHYLIINRRYGKQQLPLPMVYASSEEDPAFVVCRVPPGE